MKTERRSKRTASAPLYDEQGRTRQVEEFTEEMRVQYLDGTWSEWKISRVWYMSGATPVNLLDDGSFQLAHPPSRLTPTRPD